MDKIQKQTLGPVGLILQARAGGLVTVSTDEQIKATLATCCSYLGISNQPDQFATAILIDFVNDKLKLFTLEEMILAFKNLAANEYIVEQEHYGKLSPAYLKDVMDSYKYWRDKHRGSERRKELEPTEEMIEIDYKDCYEFIDGYAQKNKQIPFGANWAQAYDYMYREQIINPTDKERANIRALTAKNESVKDEQVFSRACKKEYVVQYFEIKYGLTRKQIIN